jgi:hypothetical protein
MAYLCSFCFLQSNVLIGDDDDDDDEHAVLAHYGLATAFQGPKSIQNVQTSYIRIATTS